MYIQSVCSHVTTRSVSQRFLQMIVVYGTHIMLRRRRVTRTQRKTSPQFLNRLLHIIRRFVFYGSVGVLESRSNLSVKKNCADEQSRNRYGNNVAFNLKRRLGAIYIGREKYCRSKHARTRVPSSSFWQ